jgi:cell division transport system permease protein
MIVLVIGVTLALPAAINVIIKNAQSVSGSWDNALDFSVYLVPDITIGEAEGLASLIAQRADIESVDLVTADQALAEW